MRFWTPPERRELEGILLKEVQGRFDPADEPRLRTLVGKANPGAEGLPLPNLIRASHIAYGVQVAYDLLASETPASA